MRGGTKVNRPASALKRQTKRARMMTDEESSCLLESVSQALTMVQGSKLVGARIIVRRVAAGPRPRQRER